MMGKNEIDIIILAGLLEGPAHGYQLKQRIDLRFGQFYINLSQASLYSRLQKFESESLVTGRIDQEKLPARKVFTLTEAGRRRLLELIATPVEMTGTMWPEMHDLTVHAVLFSLISRDRRRAVVMPFIERAERQQGKGQHAIEQYRSLMDPFMLATIEWGMKSVAENLKYFYSLLEMD